MPSVHLKKEPVIENKGIESAPYGKLEHNRSSEMVRFF